MADKIKNVLESIGIPCERGIYTGKKKPEEYCTFIRLLKDAATHADDKGSGEREIYRITLFSKGNFEELLEKLIDAMEAEDFYINGVDTEQYEPETGYWMVPITIEILGE